VVERDELVSFAEADHQAAAGTQASRKLREERIEIVRVGVDERIPGQDSAQTLVLDIQSARVPDPIRHFGVALPSVVDELGDGIDPWTSSPCWWR